MDSVNISKIVTIIQDDQKNAKVFSFKKKSDFWNSQFLKDAVSLSITCNVNNNQVINKLKKLGFNVCVDHNWGFSWDVKIIANK